MKEVSAESAARGRWLVAIAAVLWSLGGLLTRVLQRDTILNLNEPALSPLQIACFRALFAGLFFLPAIRPQQITFRPLMLLMVVMFRGDVWFIHVCAWLWSCRQRDSPPKYITFFRLPFLCVCPGRDIG